MGSTAGLILASFRNIQLFISNKMIIYRFIFYYCILLIINNTLENLQSIIMI